eukprot:CAMPEP_0184016746 /NCGR_PEP_ID=MMETSP0954-20121128/7102_1 /TAXON_ID=627963 /ORGANISM="Aplanochytrium sp, Strain PBS07" /LENGTH=240 /DNA_ID=CAMNT_0026297805 /DNA_START=287 /DNA_END=1006 /DNA_ORIENTATION=+
MELLEILVVVSVSLASIVAWRVLMSKPSSEVVVQDSILFLVIAHPDDESMFFAPTLSSFDPSNVFVLCLSNGNFDGLGKVRDQELRTCLTEVFQIPESNINVVDDHRLQDGKDNDWDTDRIATLVFEKVMEVGNSNPEKPVFLVTFDEHGVSYHPNHIDTSKGVARMFSKFKIQLYDLKLSGFQLKSVSFLEKFIGPLALLTRPDTPFDAHDLDTEILFANANFGKVYMAMKSHASQFVW